MLLAPRRLHRRPQRGKLPASVHAVNFTAPLGRRHPQAVLDTPGAELTDRTTSAGPPP
ncbi:hypothetical protein [Kitasatospora sp. NPDC059673]|uniref:hypothetical protein n=1 Tax=Kitasatospora sp. NPDC059673 TaxID=3346901 RepID=UPI0036900945